MGRNPRLEFDRLQMYFAEPYVIDLEDVKGVVTIYQPTIGDLIRIGEKRFYSTLNIFITNTTACRLQLWEMKPRLDWNVVSDFELFTILYKGIDPEVAKLIFKDLDFSKFEIYVKKQGDKQESILFDPENEVEINSDVYNHISQYLRSVFNIFPEEKITKDPVLKQWYIQKDMRERTHAEEKAAKGKLEASSSLQATISACVNHPGFKYKLHELREVGVCEFYDSVKRLQVYESTTACLKGMYSGFCDSSKIKPDEYNFMKEIKEG